MSTTLDGIVYVGFNSRVIALDQDTGEVLWHWVSPRGSGFVSLLVMDTAHLIVSVEGYTYCLHPGTGEQFWFNELKGHGVGVTSIAALGMPTSHAAQAAHIEAEAAKEE